MSPKRPRVSDATKRRRLRAFARKAIAMLKNEHAAVHAAIDGPMPRGAHSVNCEPYLEAIREGEEALR